MILNSKGGAGKTTLATNLACYYLRQGFKTALVDFDPQGSSTFWAKERPSHLGTVQLIEASKQPMGVTGAKYFMPEPGTQITVVDTSAGMDVVNNSAEIQKSDVILIPVLPSPIDMDSATKLIADLLLKVRLNRSKARIAVVANRCRKNTVSFRKLKLFLHSLNIPFIGVIWDSQFYVRTCEKGAGIFDLP
ncbi:MAG: ParA family protein, partial [Endozoicomonas sp.]